MVEHTTENRSVDSSILSLATITPFLFTIVTGLLIACWGGASSNARAQAAPHADANQLHVAIVNGDVESLHYWLTVRHADVSVANAAEPDITPLQRCLGLVARVLDPPPDSDRHSNESSSPSVGLRTLQSMVTLLHEHGARVSEVDRRRFSGPVLRWYDDAVSPRSGAAETEPGAATDSPRPASSPVSPPPAAPAVEPPAAQANPPVISLILKPVFTATSPRESCNGGGHAVYLVNQSQLSVVANVTMFVEATENAKGHQESESYTVNPESSWRLGCDRSKDGRRSASSRPGSAFHTKPKSGSRFAVDAADRARDFAVFGRLRDGVTAQQSRQALDRVSLHIKEQYPDTLPGYAIASITLRENLVDHQDSTMLALLLVVGFLLLLACINVANLVLARSVSRTKEFTIRAALGAGRGRQFRQMLTETVLLALIGGAAGLLLAEWLTRFMATLIPSSISEQLGMGAAGLDGRVLLFTLAVSVLAGILAGIVPAFASANAAQALKDGGRSSSADGRASHRLLNAFVVAQTGLAVVLLVGAGLMLQNFQRLQRRPLGFDPRQLLTVEFTPAVAAYPPGAPRAQATVPARDRRHRTIARHRRRWRHDGQSARRRRLECASPDRRAPGRLCGRCLQRQSSPRQPGAAAGHADPLQRGRSFTWEDDDRRPGVVIVSDEMARRFWPNQDPIGKRVRIARPNAPWLTVVGIAGNVSDARDPGDPPETWYLPYLQQASAAAAQTGT